MTEVQTTVAATPTEGVTSSPAAQAPASADASAAIQQPAPGAAVEGQDTTPAPAADQGDPAAQTAPEGDSIVTTPVVPEEYADFTLPEGVQLPADMNTGLKSLAKELSLTQEQAQKLADFASDRTSAIGKAQADALLQVRTEWVNQSKVDPEIGGEKFAENLGVAREAFDKFTTPAFRELLKTTGMENNPEIIRAFFRVGKAVTPDRQFVTAGNGGFLGNGDKAKSLYPSLN